MAGRLFVAMLQDARRQSHHWWAGVAHNVPLVRRLKAEKGLGELLTVRVEWRKDGAVIAGPPLALAPPLLPKGPQLALEIVPFESSEPHPSVEVPKWVGVDDGDRPGSEARKVRITPGSEGTYSFQSAALPCEAGQSFRFSGWVRLKGELRGDVRFSVVTEGKPAEVMLSRDIPRVDGAWVFIPPVEWTARDAAMRLRLQFVPVREADRVNPEVEVSYCDWNLQAAPK